MRRRFRDKEAKEKLQKPGPLEFKPGGVTKIETNVRTHQTQVREARIMEIYRRNRTLHRLYGVI